MKCVLLCLLCYVSCGIVSCLHAATATVNGITWTYQVSNGKAKIYGGYDSNNIFIPAIPWSTSGAITIPSILDGYSVTSIGWAAFEGCSSLTSVTIPSSVTTIGDRAFSRCTGLTSVTIPSSVTTIGDGAFYNCSGLTSVTIPSSVTSIENFAFYGCSSLTSVTIPSTVTSIGHSAFSMCTSLTSVTIPKGVISIGESVFSGCSNLWKDANGVQYESDEKVILVNVPTSIAGEFVVPNTVRIIHSDAFYGCSSLTSVMLPSSVMSIGRDAFKGCSRLPRDKDGVQYESAAKNVLIFVPSSYYTAIPTIHRGHFTIPSSVRLICSEAFHNHSGLLSVTIPSSVTFIGDSAFENCTGLSSITLREGVMIIGSSAFQGCSGLKSVPIPDSGVVWIGDYAFAGCSALPSFKIPLSVVSIGDSAFEGCERLSAWLPRNFSSMRIIGKRAFYNCVGFEIPSGVTSIGNEAFYNCRFRTVVIPSSVTSIGKEAFSGCRDLMSVTIPSSVTSIGERAFFGVDPKVLAAAWLPSGMFLWNLTTLIIPEDAPSIGPIIGPIVVGGGPLSSLDTVIFLGGVPSDILDVQILAVNGYYTPQYAEEWEQAIKDGKCWNLTMSPISALPSEMACEYVISPFGEVFLSFYVNSLSKWEGHAFFELSCHSLTTGKSYKAKSITMTSEGIDASGNVGVVKVKWDMAKDGIFLNGEKVKFQVKWLDAE